MNLSRFATHHVKAILFASAALCVAGAMLLHTFPVAILPDVTFPRIVVIAESDERPPRMMESGVARPLEEAVASVPGVNRMRTRTQRGATQISVDFAWGTDMLVAQQLLNAKVNEVRSELPAETHVSVERMNPTVFPILGMSLRANGSSQSELWSLATYTIRPRLARVPGVARVVVQGGRTPEIAVDVIPARLAALRLSILDVEQALASSNVTRAVGRMDRQFQQYQALVSGETTNVSQLGNITVAERGGVPIYLRQVANIGPSVEDRTTVVTADGQESVLINIVRQPDANTVSVVAGVRRALDDLKPLLPRETKIGVFYDQSTLIREAVGSVRDAVLIGAALAVIVLLLFLGDWIATIVTAAIIPVTLLVTFLLMRLSGLSLNLMTLGSLAVGIGLVIDDAIVIVENVFRHLSHGEASEGAVELAANEIAIPMITRTLTTIVVFLPLVLLVGVEGAFFTAFAVTLTLSITVSLFLALLVSPSLCSTFLKTRVAGREHGRLLEGVIEGYEAAMRCGMKRRWILPVSAVVIIALTLLMGSRLGTGFMPTMDEGAFVLDYVTPPGTSLTESDRLLRQIERILKDTPEVAAYSRRTGTELGFAITEPNSGDFAVTLKSGPRRNIEDVMEEIRERINSEVPAVDVDFVEVLQDLIGDLSGAGAPVEVRVFGQDQAQLESAARRIASDIGRLPGIVDVKTGVVEAGPELIARIDPAKAGRVGLTPDTVATQVNAAMTGDIVTQLMQGDRQIGVRVRYPAAYRSDLANMSSLPIWTPGNYTLPLSALGRVETVPGTTELNREDQRRMVSVSARLSNRDLGGAQRDIQRIMRGNPLPAGVTYVLGGEFKSQSEAFNRLLTVLLLAVVLVFAVMLFQFASFTAPTVIILVMPLSLFGVVLALWMTGTPLNVSSFMGAVMLVGMVVKNGILLLDQAKRAEKRGASVEESVLEAGRLRLRPILMTTLTAIFGLVPLSLGLGAGAEMQKPLAIAVIGGLSLSTVFMLFFAPLMYVSLRQKKRIWVNSLQNRQRSS